MNLESMQFNTSVEDYNLGEYYWVKVTHIVSPESFYVRPVEYRTAVEIMEQPGELLRPMDLFPGITIIYKSKTLNSYIRGQILYTYIDDKDRVKCDMNAIDYGFIDTHVSFKKLYKPRFNTSIDPLAIHCQLLNCRPVHSGTFSEEAIVAMKKYIGTDRAKMIPKGRDAEQLVVELFNNMPSDISTMLALTNYSSMASSAECNIGIPCTRRKCFFYPTYKIGQELLVTYQTGDTLNAFFVIDVHDYEQYLTDREDFTDYCLHEAPDLSAKDLVVKKCVGVLPDGAETYERGMITNIANIHGRINVMLVDCGYTIQANMAQMKVVTCQMYFERPMLSIYCHVERSHPGYNDLENILHPGMQFTIQFKHLGDVYHYAHTVLVKQ